MTIHNKYLMENLGIPPPDIGAMKYDRQKILNPVRCLLQRPIAGLPLFQYSEDTCVLITFCVSQEENDKIGI